MSEQPLGLRRVVRVSLIDSLVADLEGRIVAGEYPDGSRLPGEGALASAFGVSRPVVREALARLRERGYVATVNGRGTFARLPAMEDLSESLLRHLRAGPSAGFSVDDLYEARDAIEVLAAAKAAERADEADLMALRGYLSDMHSHRDDPATYTAADVGFHAAVARAAKNALVGTLLVPLARAIVRGVLRSSDADRDAVAVGIRGHHEILRRIESRDALGAAAAMHQHLADSRRLFPVEALATGAETERGSAKDRPSSS